MLCGLPTRKNSACARFLLVKSRSTDNFCEDDELRHLQTGDYQSGHNNCTFDCNGMTIFVKAVPAQVCTNCGNDYVDEQVANKSLPSQNAWQRGWRRSMYEDIHGSAMPC
jgi:YgiT-type zinc finger domain-containing protein